MTIWNLLFYVDLETSSKMKLICVPTHYYLSIPFSAVNSISFLIFSHACQIYVSEVLIIHFCRYCHLRLLSPWVWSEVNIVGQLHLQINLHLWIHIHVLSFEGPLHLQFQSHMSHLRWWGVNSVSGSTSVQPDLVGGQLHLHPTWAIVVGGSSPDPSPFPGSYFCSTYWGSTPSLVPVPYMSHLRWRGVNSISGSTFVQCELIGGVNSISGSLYGSTSIQPELIVGDATPALAPFPSNLS